MEKERKWWEEENNLFLPFCASLVKLSNERTNPPPFFLFFFRWKTRPPSFRRGKNRKRSRAPGRFHGWHIFRREEILAQRRTGSSIDHQIFPIVSPNFPWRTHSSFSIFYQFIILFLFLRGEKINPVFEDKKNWTN